MIMLNLLSLCGTASFRETFGTPPNFRLTKPFGTPPNFRFTNEKPLARPLPFGTPHLSARPLLQAAVTPTRFRLSSCHETSRRFLRYGNFFPSTFPEVLLAHASQMTGQLSQSMQIRRARDSINAMLATIISESFTSPWTRDGFSV